MAKHSGEVVIRNVEESDIERIKDIDRALLGSNRALSWPLRVEAHWWLRTPTLNFVAEIDDDVVGFLLGDIRGIEYGTLVGGWIDMMGIAPEHQGKGIGRKLVEAFCEECQRNGAKVRVVVREDDQRLIPFWTALDFQRGNLISYER